MQDRHSTRATLALQRLSETDPAFASLSLWCGHRDAAGADERGLPAWTDGRTIFYGAPFQSLAAHEQTGLAAHHILHVAFRHVARSRGMWGRLGDRFDAELFNIATDAIVNQTLILAGYALPRPSVTLVALLREALGEAAAPETAVGAWDAEKLYLRLAERPRSGAGGRVARTGDGDADAAPASASTRTRAYALRNGFDADLHGRDDAAEARVRTEDEGEWRQRVARALEAGRLAGRGIGAIGHRLADLPRSVTPWEVILRALVAKAVTDAPRRAWGRPTRRWIALDSVAREADAEAPAFEPGTVRRVDVPRIAVGIDASGSIDDTLLALFAAQIAGIGRRMLAEVHVFVFDDGVRSHQVMRGPNWEAELGAMTFGRGGGTSFVELFAAAAKITPSVIVVLTDLEGPTGPAPAAARVIWAVPDGTPRPAPAFGRVLSLAR